jgi:hypothetical protein
LLCDAATLVARLDDAVRGEEWLDAYLFSASLWQLTEDRLHADPFLLNRTANYLHGGSSRLSHLVAAFARGASAATRLSGQLAKPQLREAGSALGELTARLANHIMNGEIPGDPCRLLDAIRSAAPAMGDAVIRVPSCFHSFDLHPDDVRWLADKFSSRYPSSDRPLCVVGVRTSGCFLGPLLAAALRAAGFPNMTVLTYRPGWPFLRRERAVLRATAAEAGLVLVTDDPPGSGASLASTADALGAAGIPPADVVLLFSVFGSVDDIPAALSAWPVVAQPWLQWRVHARLEREAVRETLTRMLGTEMAICDLQRLQPTAPADERAHVRARFAVQLANSRTGETTTRQILVEGAGLGYFGRQAVAVAEALPGQVPRVYGYADGLVFRDWLPAAEGAGPRPMPPQGISQYVVARASALPAPGASVARLGGRDPVWEVAAKLMSRQYWPRLAVPVRALLLDPLMRRLLRHDRAMVVDGKTDSQHWLPDPGNDGALRKVDFYQRTFGHLDLACYDPVFDLAGAAADPPDPGFEAKLRAAYEDATGETIDGERWLLYRLAQLWRLERARDLDSHRVKLRSAEAVQEYLAGLYLSDLPLVSGPACAIDLDGVLECDRLGYSAPSPTGVLSLRSLIGHGYRPVLVSGRSLPEIRHRCSVFGLVGGVAEYGAALCIGEHETDLRSPADAELLDQIRDELTGLPGVQVDPGYRYAVRARTANGPVPASQIFAAPAIDSRRVRVIHGQNQTDITTVGFDKGAGLAALLLQLGDAGCALAVGDSAPDLPMFALASQAWAPRNAQLGPGGEKIKLTKGGYQVGLAEACADLLGHHPGDCPACRPPGFSPRTKALLSILDLNAGGLAMFTRTAALSTLLIRSHRW